jgi:hypothetical protein
LQRCEEALLQRLVITTAAASLVTIAKGVGVTSAAPVAGGVSGAVAASSGLATSSLASSGAGVSSGIASPMAVASGTAVKLGAAGTVGAAGHLGTATLIVGYQMHERNTPLFAPGNQVLQPLVGSEKPHAVAPALPQPQGQPQPVPSQPALEVAQLNPNSTQSPTSRSVGKVSAPTQPSLGARGSAPSTVQLAVPNSAAVSTLADEALVLTQTEQLIARGQEQAALELLRQSDQRFPASGGLSVERLALRALVLCKSSSLTARAAGVNQAKSLLTAHPASPLRARLESECFTNR